MSENPGGPHPPPPGFENKLNNRRASWTPERRAAQAERARRNRPWEKSTGPRTAEGKAVVRENALKDGKYDATMRELIRLLRRQRDYLRSLDIPAGIYPMGE